jgi:hypothetical protein
MWARFWLSSCCLLVALTAESRSAACADSLQRIVEISFRNAIVKIDVSSKTPVIRDGKNLCLSEGTGFLVSSSFVASAGHVFELDPGCGELTIVLRSRRNNVARVAKLIESANDLALLSVEEPFQSPMCFVTLMSDAFDIDGFRIGIPGGLQDPVPMNVVIGSEHAEWEPLVLLTPTPAEHGESGGPIIVDFNVVGIMKAKHMTYNGLSFMMKGSILRNLMLKYKVTLNGQMCNPVTFRMAGNSASLQADSDLSSADQTVVLNQIKKVLTEKVSAVQNEVKVTQVGSSINISGGPQVVIRQHCTNVVFGLAICKSVPEVVYDPAAASAAANKVASEIRELTAIKLWRDLKN